MGPVATISLSFPQPDIALLTLDAPDRAVNVLSAAVLDELAIRLAPLADRDDLAGLVIRSAKSGCFAVHMDRRDMAACSEHPSESIAQRLLWAQDRLRVLSTLPCMTVAAIDGSCLGAGAELALWCDRRVLSDSPQTVLGFPELQLGLIPGWGGTARAARIAGLANAIAWITRGKMVSAADARALGLADDCVPVERLLPAAIDLIRQQPGSGQFRQDRQRWSRPVELPAADVESLVTAQATRLRRHQPRDHNPAPWVALETLQAAAVVDLDAACRLEAEAAAQLCRSPVHAALLNDYFLRMHNQDDSGDVVPGIAPLDVGSLAVIGTGIMGSGIAAVSAKQGIAVTMSDANPQALSHGLEQAIREVSSDGRTSAREADRAHPYASLLRGSTSDADIAGCDVVIEAVVENPDVKRQIYQRLEPLLPPHVVLASNTSSIRISHLAQVLSRPDRFCGMHFFNPVREMQLVEVIRGPQTRRRRWRRPWPWPSGWVNTRSLCRTVQDSWSIACWGST